MSSELGELVGGFDLGFDVFVGAGEDPPPVPHAGSRTDSFRCGLTPSSDGLSVRSCVRD